jgi:5'-3' exonuclease
MNLLSEKIQREFSYKESQYGVKKIIVSGSIEPGEGEHKMYEHLRKNTHNDDNVAIYGLDSDLIMLSIFNSMYCKNMYIFRETPVFGDLGKHIKMNEESAKLPLFLDISLLIGSILTEMNCTCSTQRRVYDYVFLCFFLGNDFLPHFPALNIRTHGIQVLLDTYRKIFGKNTEKYLLN